MVFDEHPWSKQHWKNTIKTAINDHLEENWHQEISQLSSLQMLNPHTIKVGIPHPAWETAGYSLQATKEAISKIRMLTDTMMTGEKLNLMYGQNPKCLCSHPFENRSHLLLDCSIYQDVREHCISRMIHLIVSNHPEISEICIRDRTILTLLLLDPTWFPKDKDCPIKLFQNILTTSKRFTECWTQDY